MEIKLSDRLRSVFGIKVRNYHKGVRTFLEKNPFIFIDQGKLNGLISIEQGHPLTHEEVQSLANTYSIPGLDCLVIASSQGFSQEAQEVGYSNSICKVELKLTGEKEEPFIRFTSR